MHEEGRASIHVGAQHAQAFVGRVPRLHHDVIQFVAQEVFDHALVPRFHFEEIRKHAHRRKPALHHPGLKQPTNRLGRISMFGDDGFE